MTETAMLVLLGTLTYFVLAPLLASLICGGDEGPSNFLHWSVIILATPATLCWLLLLGFLSIPYFELYPERHAHSIDFEGTDEQKAAIADYRRRSAERSFLRRCLEYCRLCTCTKPDLPQPVVEYERKFAADRRLDPMNDRNALTEQSIKGEPNARIHFTISTLLYVMLLAAIALAVYAASPDHKVLSGLNVLCGGFTFASASHIPGIWPFANRLTLTEIVTLLLCCLIVNGLRILPVTTQ